MRTQTEDLRRQQAAVCCCECGTGEVKATRRTAADMDIGAYVRAVTGRDDLAFDRLLLK